MLKRPISLPWDSRQCEEKSEEIIIKRLDKKLLPVHIAIIMDGNGRWALKKGLPRKAGHRAGVNTLREIVKTCRNIGIKILTVYAFSTENWKRPQEEVKVLMDLLADYLQKEAPELHRNGIKVEAIGQIDELPQKARLEIYKIRELTKSNDKLTLNLALNYGGRAEIIRAVRQIATEVKNGNIEIDHINQELFSNFLYTRGQPDPDLLIRPSGELRLSNFLLWQTAYTEFWISDVYWPDFKKIHLLQALYDYQKRDRRFGGLKI